ASAGHGRAAWRGPSDARERANRGPHGRTGWSQADGRHLMSGIEPIIAIERHGNVALLQMRAGKANAMNVRLLEALDATLEDVDDADAIAITGEGKAFSAGLALPELILLDREEMTHM